MEQKKYSNEKSVYKCEDKKLFIVESYYKDKGNMADIMINLLKNQLFIKYK